MKKLKKFQKLHFPSRPQQQIAKELGIDQPTVSRICKIDKMSKMHISLSLLLEEGEKIPETGKISLSPTPLEEGEKIAKIAKISLSLPPGVFHIFQTKKILVVIFV